MSNAQGTKIIELTGVGLNIEQVYKIAHAPIGAFHLAIDPQALKRMGQSRQKVYDIVEQGRPVYGINTGFGALSSQKIERKDLEQLQINIIRSHCTGVGNPFSRAQTRAIMLLRANCLISGFSGVAPVAVELLLDFINFGIHPIVPCKGSVGASGDLAPLSHVALALIGEGQVEFEGKEVRADFALSSIGKKALRPGPKDGLALINGTAVMAALGALATYEAQRLMKQADIITALTLEGLRGTASAYHPQIGALKPHPGQIGVTHNLNLILQGSQVLKSHPDCGKVQDPYSLRCVPQVHGACRQTLSHAKEVLSIELNAVTDNPLIFLESDEVVSGGNFHGQAVSFCMDYLAMGLSELCSMSERRIEKMMNPTFSDLPAFLAKEPGLNSGLMIAHVTAAALTSENKIWCHPASVDSIPTSTDKEDHVSMGVTAGRKLLEVTENLRIVLAIELLCSTQALEFHRPLKSSAPLEATFQIVRRHIPSIEQDRVFSGDIQKLAQIIQSGEILTTVECLIGELQ